MYDDNLLTPEEIVESILNQMNNDLINGSYDVVCDQLDDLWNQYCSIIMSVSALNKKYNQLCSRCKYR